MNLEAFGQAPCVYGWMAVATIQIVNFFLKFVSRYGEIHMNTSEKYLVVCKVPRNFSIFFRLWQIWLLRSCHLSVLLNLNTEHGLCLQGSGPDHLLAYVCSEQFLFITSILFFSRYFYDKSPFLPLYGNLTGILLTPYIIR